MAFSTSGQRLALASSWFNGDGEAAASRQPGTRSRFTPAMTMAKLLIEISRLTVFRQGAGHGPPPRNSLCFSLLLAII
jgi:hypothetical protein